MHEPEENPVAKVSLFRCRLCNTKMFWRDCRGHMNRHGVYPNGDLRQHFARGPKDVPQVPGALWKPLNHGRTKKRRAPVPT